jgi:hypothetical protein
MKDLKTRCRDSLQLNVFFFNVFLQGIDVWGRHKLTRFTNLSTSNQDFDPNSVTVVVFPHQARIDMPTKWAEALSGFCFIGNMAEVTRKQ